MRIAIITIAFPPSSHSNGKRPFYLAKGFLEAGWSVDVYTSNLRCDRGYDEVLRHENLNIVRVDDPLVRGLEFIRPISFLYRLAVGITNVLVWPDFYVLWSKRVIKILAAKRNYDRVLAFVFPPSIYLASKRKSMIDERWIFDLQESVTPQLRVVPRRSPLQKILQPRLVKLEKDALSKAGHIVFTAETNLNAYVKQRLVDMNKIHHIPYFYEFNEFCQTDIEQNKIFEICYFGAFDWRGNRSPRVFFTSLAKFLELYPEARSLTSFSFYGHWLPDHDDLLHELKLVDVVKIGSAVPYREYLQLLASASVLLLIVAREHNLFMPSKIVDYFGARRPVLAFVPADSEMHRVLEKAGMADQAVGEKDVAGGVKALEALWLSYSSGDLGEIGANTEFWSADAQIPRYVKLMSD